MIVRTYCGHKGCRVYKLKNMNLAKGVFDVYANDAKIIHRDLKTRQVRGMQRELLKFELAEKSAGEVYDKINKEQEQDKVFIDVHKTTKAKTMHVLKRIRTESFQTKDIAKYDIFDIIEEYEKQVRHVNDWVQNFSIYPFYVITRSEMQIQMLHMVRTVESDKQVTAYFNKIEGKIKSPDDNPDENPIIYYSLSISVDDDCGSSDQFPLTDLITTDHSFRTIGQWLFAYHWAFVENFQHTKAIDNVMVDFNYFQLDTTLSELSRQSTVEFLISSYHFITGATENENRTNVFFYASHVIYNLFTDIDSHFNNSTRCNTILKEVITSIFVISDYEEIKSIWKNLCTIFCNNFVCEEVETALTTLMKSIRVTQDGLNMLGLLYIQNETLVDTSTDELFSHNLYSHSPFYLEFREISNAIHESGKHLISVNSFYNLDIMELLLIKYITFLPFWSGLLRPDVTNQTSVIFKLFDILKRRPDREICIPQLPTTTFNYLRYVREKNFGTFNEYKFKNNIITE